MTFQQMSKVGTTGSQPNLKRCNYVKPNLSILIMVEFWRENQLNADSVSFPM